MQNEGKHPRHGIDVHDDNDERDEEIQPSHDRHEERRKRRDAAETSKDHERRQHREGDAHDPRLHAERLLHRQRNRIRLYRDVDQAERHGDQHGKELCHGGLTECILDVVGRAAVKEPVAARNLIDLRERALYEPRRRPNEGNRPHPEHRPGAARHNGDGNARDIADADTRCRADTERLERRDRLAPARAASEIARKEAYHLGQRTQLDELRREREPQSAADKNNDDDISPQKVVDRPHSRVEKIHRITLSYKNSLHHTRKKSLLSNCIHVFFHIFWKYRK